MKYFDFHHQQSVMGQEKKEKTLGNKTMRTKRKSFHIPKPKDKRLFFLFFMSSKNKYWICRGSKRKHFLR
jgi:hypothetical protein